MDFGKKLRTLRKSKGLTQQALADLMGVHLNTVNKWEQLSHLKDLDRLEQLASILGVGVTALRGEEVSATPQPIQNIRPIRGGVVEVPVLRPQSSICCGKGFDINDVDPEVIRYELVPEEWELGPRGDYPLYITYIEGDSMEPLLEAGGRILVNPNEEVTHGKVAVVAWNGYSMVRGVAFERNGDIKLRARNPSYQEILIKADDAEYVLRWCGVVKRFLGRDRPVTGFF